jgi:predicted Zn-dependent protease
MGFSEQEKAEFKRASTLYEQGNIKEALPILEQLARQRPDSGILLATLANTYWDLGMLENAERYFVKAVNTAPDVEKISLGYFHLLWDIGKKGDAINEIQRFQENSTLSNHYKEIAEEVNEKTDYKIIIKKE